MKHNINFAKKDVVVALGCVVFLLASLGAVGDSGRKRAKEAVCLSNLRQWGLISQIHTESNDGKFWTGLTREGYWWPWQLESHLKDWKINRIWFCPTATKPITEVTGTPNIFTAWGIYGYNDTESHTDVVPGRATSGKVYRAGPNGINGSYGLNGYVLNIPNGATFQGGVRAEDGWRTTNEPGAAKAPVFVDCLRFDIWPLPSDSPGLTEYDPWNNISMRRACINRHNGAVNVLFMDWSARKVGLKELWKLKWHRSFNTNGPWTTAGGATASKWQQAAPWMRNFKDF